MPERDARGCFVKGNRGNPNPKNKFKKGNTAAAKHMLYSSSKEHMNLLVQSYLETPSILENRDICDD